MEDICHMHFLSRTCHGHCGCAHDFTQLTNLECWVLFQVRTFSMGEYLVKSRKADRHYALRNYGSLVRCQTAQDANELLASYGRYCNPIGLQDYIARLSKPQLCLSLEHVGSAPSSPMSPTSVGSPISVGSPVSFGMRGLQLSLLPVSPVSPTRKPPAVDCISPQTNSDEERSPKAKRHQAGPKPKIWNKLGDRHHSSQVLALLKETPMPQAVGWQAVQRTLCLCPEDFDACAVHQLQGLAPAQQEHILLTLASIGLASPEEASSHLECLIQEHDISPQMCIHFLAGVCHEAACPYVHPHNTKGWDLLKKRWGFTYQHLDYPVLNYLAKKPMDQQDAILIGFANSNLKKVDNLSAYLSVAILKSEQKKKSPPPSESGDDIKSLPGSTITSPTSGPRIVVAPPPPVASPGPSGNNRREKVMVVPSIPLAPQAEGDPLAAYLSRAIEALQPPPKPQPPQARHRELRIQLPLAPPVPSMAWAPPMPLPLPGNLSPASPALALQGAQTTSVSAGPSSCNPWEKEAAPYSDDELLCVGAALWPLAEDSAKAALDSSKWPAAPTPVAKPKKSTVPYFTPFNCPGVGPAPHPAHGAGTAPALAQGSRMPL